MGWLRRWAGQIRGRCMGADRADEMAAINGVPGELLVRGRIEAVTALSDPAA